MKKHKYRVYLGVRTIDIVVECDSASQGQSMLERQYSCNVAWMGSV